MPNASALFVAHFPSYTICIGRAPRFVKKYFCLLILIVANGRRLPEKVAARHRDRIRFGLWSNVLALLNPSDDSAPLEPRPKSFRGEIVLASPEDPRSHFVFDSLGLDLEARGELLDGEIFLRTLLRFAVQARIHFKLGKSPEIARLRGR
jgi:hypothetical protein